MKLFTISILLSLSLTVNAQNKTDSLLFRNYVDSLIDLSFEYISNEDNTKAIDLLRKAEEIALKNLGETSFSYAVCSYYIAGIHYSNHDHIQAEKYYNNTINRLKNLPIKQTGLWAKTYQQLGYIYLNKGEADQAEYYFLSALSHLEQDEDEYHEYVSMLNDIGISYIQLGKYNNAESNFSKALALYENKIGIENEGYINSLNNLALLYEEMGYFEKSEPLHLKSISQIVKLFGKDHYHYATGIANLATLYHAVGDYRKAESLFLESNDILKRLLGELDIDYTYCLNNLANLYWEMGNLKKAESLHLQIKSIRETILGKENPEYAKSIENLAGIKKDLGLLEESKLLTLEAHKIFQNTLQNSDLTLATSLNNIASIYFRLGDTRMAEDYYNQALFKVEKIHGNEHPHYAELLYNLGDLYLYNGNHAQSNTLHKEAKNIREETYGTNHPVYAESIRSLGITEMHLGNISIAEELFIESARINRNLVTQSIHHLTENELTHYLSKFEFEQSALIAFTNQYNSPELTKTLYNNVLFYKGFILNAVIQFEQLALSRGETRIIYDNLKSTRRRLSNAYSSPLSEREDTRLLENEASDLEKKLVLLSGESIHMLKEVSWLEIKTSLKPFEAVLEFIHFDADIEGESEEIIYGALFINSDSEYPEFIPLFKEKELDHLLKSEVDRKADYVNELYAWADRGMVKLGSEKKSLYDLIWAKIEAAGLEGIKTVYYSPSGVIHRLNLGAIAVDDETILSDRYNLVALNSTRQLVIPSTISTNTNDALLVGGVNFEVDSIQTTFEEQPLLASRSIADAWTESGTRGGSWSHLKWTEKEVERIGTSLTTGGFDAVQLTGNDASEEAVKAIGTVGPSPRVLHIATHGFFFPDPDVRNQKQGLDEAEPVFKSSDNPMIRSGLILAGGNYAWQHGRAVSPDQEDGILTAYEISQMNLANTELVVLSACETGLGDIQGNEGVYGLQRAFKIAGAKYLIMSLWQVPDRETMEFMTTFYRNWLEEKLSIPDAFRKTQREMRDRFFNPYSWAGFVLVE